jgi:hypothetical protein
MPVLLANADPTFDFVDHARRQAPDLFAADADRTRLTDFAGEPQTAGAPKAPAEAAETAVERRIWGYWPRVRGSNPILIRDDLDGFAAEAAADHDHTASWVIVLMRPAMLCGLADPDRPPSSPAPLTRDLLDDLRRRKNGITPGATARQTGEITVNLYLRRVFAVMSDLGADPTSVTAAYRLVDEDLVDDVVFLAARDPHDPDLASTYFAGLRLLEALVGSRWFETWLTGSLGPLQRGATVLRLAIGHDLATIPTRGSRRLWVVQHLLERLATREHDRVAPLPSATAAVTAIREEIDDDADEQREEPLPSAAPAAEEGRLPRISWYRNPDFAGRFATVDGGWLTALSHEVATALETAVPASIENPVGWDPKVPFGAGDDARLAQEAARDREIDDHIDELGSGVLAGADESINELVTQSGRLREDVRRIATARLHTRAADRPGDDAATVAFAPPDPVVDATVRPIRIALAGDRRAHHVRPIPSAGLLRRTAAARVLIEAERGLFPGRWTGWIEFLLIVLFLCVVVTVPIATVHRATLVEVLTFARPAAAWVWYVGSALLLCATALSLTLARLRCVDAATEWRRACEALVRAADQRVARSRNHRLETTRAGRLNRLRRRLDTLTGDLETIGKIVQRHARLVTWATPGGSELDPEALRPIETDVLEKFQSISRDRWVTELLKYEIVETGTTTIRCILDGGANQEIETSVFVAPLPGDGTVVLERLPHPPGPVAVG